MVLAPPCPPPAFCLWKNFSQRISLIREVRTCRHKGKQSKQASAHCVLELGIFVISVFRAPKSSIWGLSGYILKDLALLFGFFFKIYLFTYFGLSWVFIAAQATFRCGGRRLLSSCGAQAALCSGFSSCRARALECLGISSCGS